MNNEIKDTILTVVFVALYLVFSGAMIFAVLYPCGSSESETALYIGLGAFLAGLAVWVFDLFNLD